MSSSLSHEELEAKLLVHLGHLADADRPWKLADSPLGGRGMFATRDIKVNETIFRDCTMILGPRAAKFEFPTCVMCHKRLSVKDACKNGCGMSICPGECQEREDHVEECQLISSWDLKDKTQVSMNTLRSLTTIRGLLLKGTRKEILLALQSNPCEQVVTEVERTISEMNKFPEELRPTLYHICSVLNTNAFETKLSNELHSEEDSLRGLYPLSCMMNHQCVPNVRYKFDGVQVMVVEAAKEIKAGEEIFTSYLQLFWGTLSRRLQLKATKDFMCSCPRCRDRTENNTYLSALKCAKQECTTGRLLPINPILIQSPWQCDVCGIKLEFKKISRIQDVLSSVIVGKLKNKDLRNIQGFLENTIPDILPPNNEFVLELKLYVIWRVGEDGPEGEYKVEDFLEKEQYCEELLELLGVMGSGESTIKGLLQFELFKTREALKRLTKDQIQVGVFCFYSFTMWSIVVTRILLLFFPDRCKAHKEPTHTVDTHLHCT